MDSANQQAPRRVSAKTMPCNVSHHPSVGLSHCSGCGMEWDHGKRRPNCPYIETPQQKIDRLTAQLALTTERNATLQDAVDLADLFFDEVMKRMNVGQSPLTADDIALWNRAAGACGRARTARAMQVQR